MSSKLFALLLPYQFARKAQAFRPGRMSSNPIRTMTTATEISWDDLKAMIASLVESSKETDRRLRETDELIRALRDSSKETDRRMQETDRRLRELGEQIGGLGNKFGYFTEGLALPSLERILAERFGMENISPRHRVRRDGREQEYDVLAWANGDINLGSFEK